MPIETQAVPVTDGQSVVVIGMGSGIPAKIDLGGVVQDPRSESMDFFTASTDTFGWPQILLFQPCICSLSRKFYLSRFLCALKKGICAGFLRQTVFLAASDFPERRVVSYQVGILGLECSTKPVNWLAFSFVAKTTTLTPVFAT